MIKTIAFFISLTLIYTTVFTQTSTTRNMVVIDSIPVSLDRDQSIQIMQGDISYISVIKQADSLKMLGFSDLDSVVYIFTKEYEKRPDSVKRIPSTKQMTTRKDSCFINGIPYTGQFIDYYFCGLKQSEGTYKNGRLIGQYKSYFRSGKLATQSYYIDKEEVFTTSYYPNGAISYIGQTENGKPKGISEGYFLNGQLSHRTIFKTNGSPDTTFTYYSSGKIKDTTCIVNGKWISKFNKIDELFALAGKSIGDKKKYKQSFLKIISLDSSNFYAYVAIGVIELEELNWKAAIADFDKALQLEPYFLPASVYRAFATIKYYESRNLKNRSNWLQDNVFKKKVLLQIPETVKEKLCNDLQVADQDGSGLRYVSINFIADALLNYCQMKSSR